MTELQSAAHEKPLDMVIFGGAGDLATRKLLPALYMAHLHGNLPADTRIIGVGRHDYDNASYIDFVQTQSKPFIEGKNLHAEVWQEFIQKLHYTRLDANDSERFQHLAKVTRKNAERAYYLATAPTLFTAICENLHQAGLIDASSRVVLEKPLGHDLQSAIEINNAVGRHFSEAQIYRIDHYLGKETVQNLMVLRFGNAILEPLWRAPNIRSVQITVAESVGVGSRAGFYNGTGAMRDMVQNHLLQLLCIIAMEPPVALDPDAVRDEKLKVLRSLRRMSLGDIARDTVRGQYAGGAIEGESIKAYRQEPDIPPDSTTETFVALRAHVDTWRWANVPFFLRTGKRLHQRQSQIVIDFANPPFSIFNDAPAGPANRLIIQLQPEESVQLQVMAKQPGSGMHMLPVNLDLDLKSAFAQRRAEAYERLLLDVVRGRLTHFMRRDELEAAWAWVDPILAGWAELKEPPLLYPAGSWGPDAAAAMLMRDGYDWL